MKQNETKTKVLYPSTGTLAPIISNVSEDSQTKVKVLYPASDVLNDLEKRLKDLVIELRKKEEFWKKAAEKHNSESMAGKWDGLNQAADLLEEALNVEYKET